MGILERITPLEGGADNRAEAIVHKMEVLIAESALEPGTLLGTKEGLRRRIEVSPGTLNEALRILASRGVIMMRRGLGGGIFLATSSPQVALSKSLLDLSHGPILVEESWAVLKQLEPLVVVEAVKTRTDDAVDELHRLLGKVSASTIREPIASLRWSWCLYRKIAEMGSNAVLKTIYTMLLNSVERKPEQIVPLARSTSKRLVAQARLVVEAISSGDIARAASAAARV